MDDDVKGWLDGISSKLIGGEIIPSLTTRELLARFGAQRRGVATVNTIRKSLEQRGIATSPDFATAWIDQQIHFVPWINGAYEVPTAPWAKYLQQAVEVLERGEPTEPVTVRALLNWFGAERRGGLVVANIQSALSEFGLRTEPDFRETYIDGEVSLELASATQGTGADGTEVGEPPRKSEHPGEDQSGRNEVPSPDPEGADSATPMGNHVAADPTFRIGTLRSANLKSVKRSLIRVSPNDTIAHAVTLMLAHNVSQIPVMQGDRTVRGVVTWQAVGTYLALKLGSAEDQVHKCMAGAIVTKADKSLFAAIPDVMDGDHVLIQDGHGAISGIVTANDVNEVFCELTEPFLLLGEIENYVRVLVERGAFSASELAALRNPDDKRPVQDAADLTLGELLRLLQAPANWGRIQLALDRPAFVADLEEVRSIRNDVLHFRRDRLAEEKLATLRRFARLVQGLRRARAI
jgi:CBS domain-containing protein